MYSKKPSKRPVESRPELIERFWGIESDSAFYINKPDAGYNTCWKDYLYDGEKAEKTFHNEWVKIKKQPKKISKIIKGEKINSRYELKEKMWALPEDTFPKIVLPVGSNDYGDELDTKFYDYKYEMSPDSEEMVDFAVQIIAHVTDFAELKTDMRYESPLINKIFFPTILLPTKQVKLSSETSYKLIRKYIKENLDYKNAKISSDYDFIFQVDKIIDLDAPISERYVTNLFSKKPKYVTKIKDKNCIPVYNMIYIKENGAHSYEASSWTQIAPTFESANYKELETTFNSYVKELVDFLNKPLKQCSHCKGTGVIEEKKFGEK